MMGSDFTHRIIDLHHEPIEKSSNVFFKDSHTGIRPLVSQYKNVGFMQNCISLT